MGETLYCGAKGIATSIHITKKAPEIVQFNLNSYSVEESCCKQKLVPLSKRLHNLIVL
jgi:hypothetical protein